MLLTDKYKPYFDSKTNTISPDIIGCQKQQLEFRDWLQSCLLTPPKVQSVLIIHGPNGVGKTASIEALLSCCKIRFLNVDPWDMGNKKSIEYMDATNFASQFIKDKKKKFPNCVVIIEGMLGTEEEKVEKTLDALQVCPCIFMNHSSDSSLNQLVEKEKIDEFQRRLTSKRVYKKQFKEIYFPSLTKDQIKPRLVYINEREKYGFSDEIINAVTDSAGGSLGAAINSLQFGVGFDRISFKSFAYMTPVDAAKSLIVTDRSEDSYEILHNEHMVDGKKVPHIIHETIITRASGNQRLNDQFAKICDQFSFCDALCFNDNRYTNEYESLQSILPAREFHLLINPPTKLHPPPEKKSKKQ